jgi:hypothetical protein
LKGAEFLTVYGNPLVAFHAYYGTTADNKPKMVASTIVEARADTFLWWNAPQCTGVGLSLCPAATPAQQINSGVFETTIYPGFSKEQAWDVGLVESRLDEVLVGVVNGLNVATQDAGSELSLALIDLRGAVSRLRGFISLVMPDALEDDELRTLLYGLPQKLDCERVASRVVSGATRVNGNEQNPKRCKAGETTPFGVLISPETVAFLLNEPYQADGKVNPELVKPRNILNGLSLLSAETATEFIASIHRIISEKSNSIATVEYIAPELSRLRLLGKARNSVAAKQ